MDTRRILLGDWHPLVRDGIDVLRLALVVGAVVAGIAGDAHALGYLTIAAAIALAARPLNLPRPYDLCLVLGCCLQGFGEAFGLYDRFDWFDSVVHFTIPMLGAPVIYIALARADLVPDPRDDTDRRHHIGIFVVTFALGAAIGAVWELCEWTSDHALGSALQLSNDDTVGDLLADSLGAAAGAGLLVVWTVRGWGSVRRIPGENRYEATEAPERVSSAPRRRRAAGPGSRAGSRRSG
jgi:hypothetical protein